MRKTPPSPPEELAGSSGSFYIGRGTSGRVGCHPVTVNPESLASFQCRSVLIQSVLQSKVIYKDFLHRSDNVTERLHKISKILRKAVVATQTTPLSARTYAEVATMTPALGTSSSIWHEATAEAPPPPRPPTSDLLRNKDKRKERVAPQERSHRQ